MATITTLLVTSTQQTIPAQQGALYNTGDQIVFVRDGNTGQKVIGDGNAQVGEIPLIPGMILQIPGGSPNFYARTITGASKVLYAPGNMPFMFGPANVVKNLGDVVIDI